MLLPCRNMTFSFIIVALHTVPSWLCCSILNFVGPFRTMPSFFLQETMVQLFYYENRGKCCRKLWKHNGNTLKVQ